MNYAEAVKERFKKVFGRELNLDNPTTFNEKLLYLNLNLSSDDMMTRARYSDKLLVREVFKEKLGKDIGIPIKAVYDNSVNLRSIQVEGAHVIKCTHGFGMNFFFDGHLTTKQIKEIQASLHATWSKKNFEEWYKFIDHKLILEEKLPNEIRDVHVLCFNGKALVYEEPIFPVKPGRIFDEDGYQNEEFSLSTDTHISYYDKDWNLMRDVVRARVPNIVGTPSTTPENLNAIKTYAETLAKGFKFMRVDFIISGDKVYGEKIVFSPTGGFSPFLGNGDTILGNMLTVK